MAELEAVERYLEDPAIRLLTLTGPGGTGKTSLAIRAARDQSARFRDGVSFVDVSAARDADGLILALGRAVGVGEVPARSIREALAERLRERQVLLVLDNFEQVTSAAWVTTELLDKCPQVKLLVTSREPLRVGIEHVFPIPPLGLPPETRRRVSAAEVAGIESIELFVDRARAVRPDFAVTDDNAAAVVEICRRLDGLPLAIELAAARLRLFSPEALRDRLGSRLELLRSAARDVPERQQTLRATIDWSYALLEPAEQRVFEGLAVFADADVRAIEAVAAAAGSDGAVGEGATGGSSLDIDVIESLASLIEKSLVRQVDAAGGEPRVRMLETIREFATEQLDQAPRGGRRPTRPRRLLRRPGRLAAPRPVGRRPGPGDGRDDDRGRELPDRPAVLGRAGRRRRADEARQQPPHPQRGPWLVPRHGRAGLRHARDPDPHGQHARARRQGDRAPVDARPRAHGDAGVHARGRRGVHADAGSVRARPGIRPALFRPAFAGEPVRACAPSSTRRPRSASGSWRWPRPRTTPTC